MTILHNNINNYTEGEFLQFLEDIVNVKASDENEHHQWVRHFEKLVEHPRGNGLIYWPDDGSDGTPMSILNAVKKWRSSQGLPSFKDSK